MTRRVHKVGTVTVAGQKFRVGTAWAGQLLTVRVDAELFHLFSDPGAAQTVPPDHPQRRRPLRADPLTAGAGTKIQDTYIG